MDEENALPARLADDDALDELLSRPNSDVVSALSELPGDLMVLGAAGKMGPTLTRMARRASPARRIVAVSRFSSPGSELAMAAHGVETVLADLLEPDALSSLPNCPLIVYMAGQKFGATHDPAKTWAMNAVLPGLVCQRFPESRIVAFSTGNVYPLTPLSMGGSVESDPVGPVGEYAMSCLGRERIFEHFSRTRGTRVSILRLNYATELRYGVAVDIARKVWRGEPVPLSMGMANLIWQGDANAMALRSLALADSPATIWNLAGPEQISVRRLATFFGERMSRDVVFEGVEAPTALLSNGQRLLGLLGNPRVPVAVLLEWIADWVARGGSDLGKPTRFEARDGQF